MAKEQQLLFAEADGGHAPGANTEAGQVVLGALRTTLTQGQIVLLGATRVTVAFYPDGDILIVFQEVSISFNARYLVAVDAGAVKGKPEHVTKVRNMREGMQYLLVGVQPEV